MGDLFISNTFTLERTKRRLNPPVRRGLQGLYLFGASEEFSLYNHAPGGFPATVTAGGALPFDDHSSLLASSTNRVDLGYGDEESGSFAVVMRLNVNAASNAERPNILETEINSNGGVDLLEWTGDKIRMRVGSDGQKVTAEVGPADLLAWRLIIGTWSPTSMTISDMTDGLSDTTALSGPRVLGDANWCVGGTTDNTFDGSFHIAPLMIANVVWTEAEHEAIHQGLLPYCTRRGMNI